MINRLTDINPEKDAHIAARRKDFSHQPLQTSDPGSVILLMRVVEMLAAVEYELILARHERRSQNGGMGSVGP